MCKLVFLHFTNAPTEDAVKTLPDDIDAPNQCAQKLVFFHDGTTFTANEVQPTQWGMKGEKIMKKKSKGAGIMVSDFIDGFLALTDEDIKLPKSQISTHSSICTGVLEYESKEGYWTRDKFIAQMRRAIEIAEITFPKAEGWCHEQ